MHGVDTQPFKIVDSLLFSKREKLALVAEPGCRLNGEVAMVHLIDDNVGEVFRCEHTVISPTLWVGCAHVDYGSPLAVHSHRLGEHTWSLALSDVERIEFPFLVAFKFHGPEIVAQPPHAFLDHRLRVNGHVALGIHIELYVFRLARGEELEDGACRRIVNLVEVEILRRGKQGRGEE